MPLLGAQLNGMNYMAMARYFQSTLPRGERRWRNSEMPRRTYFNPRSREGSDICHQLFVKCEFDISIHAPARGATCVALACGSKSTNFNPRSREGSDPRRSISKSKSISDFNPRSREGSDESSQRRRIQPVFYFNPRSREGSDLHFILTFIKVCFYFNPRSREGSDRR